MVRKRLFLDQIPFIWKVKCSGEREEMDSHVENLWSFEPLISTLLSGDMGLVFFFFIASALVFFKEDDPHSIMIEFSKGSTAWIDHSRWIGSLWRFWNCLTKVDINTRGR